MKRTLLIALGLAALGACKDANSPDLNNPTVPPGGVISNPSRTQLQQLVNGVLNASRTDHAAYIRDFEIIARDAYNLDGADPRWITELLGAFDPGGFGGNHWLFRYNSVATENIVIGSIETAAGGPDYTAEEIGATVGFAQTMKAVDLMYVLEARDVNGIAADASTATSLTPILCRANAYARIIALLDSARDQLDISDGGDFPFSLPSTFSGFDNTGTFREFNRAMAARANFYAGNYAQAQADMNQSFVSTNPADFNVGVYYPFSEAPGDVSNNLYAGNGHYRAHPSFLADAEDGDTRATSKTAIGDAQSLAGHTSDILITRYTSLSDPIPIVRDEGLLLLRAQIEIANNDLTSARNDINAVRANAGLGPVGVFADQNAAITQVLYEKRYSLFWESGDRWVDYRFYDRLNSLPVDDPANDAINVTYPIPEDERLARNGAITCQ